MHTRNSPFTKLFLHEERSVVLAADSHIYVLDSKTGDILHSTARNSEQQKELLKSGLTVAASIDDSARYLVTASVNKIIRVWSLDGLHIVSEREALKKPTEVLFTRDAETILVSDKFGDVHSYPRLEHPKQNAFETSTPNGSKSKRKDAQRLHDGSLLLGHVSLLTTFLLSMDDKYIISADRDEHIRVSWYPQAYTIERYCLGHKKFVSALHIPSLESSLLLSGGGDPVIKIWKWMEGKVVHEIDIADAAMPFVKVTRRKVGRRNDGSDGEDNEGTNNKLSSRQRRRQKKKMQREGSEATNGEGDETAEMAADAAVQYEMEIDKQDNPGNAIEANTSQLQQTEKHDSNPEPLLAVQKIRTFENGSSKLLVFSLHGATALFYCRLSESIALSTDNSDVQSVDLKRPVLDFAKCPNSDEIWVSVDANWCEGSLGSVEESNFIKTVRIVGDRLHLTEDSSHTPLLKSLNTNCLTEVTAEALNEIDLYSALSVLPKNAEVEHDAMNDTLALSEAKGGQLSGKELGRLKSKKAALALEAKRKTLESTEFPDGGHEVKRKREMLAMDSS